VYSSLWKTRRIATERHLPYGITHCLLPDTDERLNPSQADRYSIYLLQRDGRLSYQLTLVVGYILR